MNLKNFIILVTPLTVLGVMAKAPLRTNSASITVFRQARAVNVKIASQSLGQ